jgi:hypothetical protein
LNSLVKVARLGDLAHHNPDPWTWHQLKDQFGSNLSQGLAEFQKPESCVALHPKR